MGLVADIQPADIESIEALMPAGTMPVVCDPIAAKRRPASDYDAKFSLPYAVASFFEQGGREAWILRIVHEHGNAALNAGGVPHHPVQRKNRCVPTAVILSRLDDQ